MEEIKWGWNNTWLKYLDLDKNNFLKIFSWSEKYLKNWSSLVSPILPWSYLLEILWYKKIFWEYLDFKDKEITDIWSWLWGLIFELENSAKRINAVDPLYSSENKLQILQKEIIRWKNRIEDIVNNIQKDIKEINNKIDKLEIEKNRNPSNHQFLYDIQDLESKKKSLEKNKNFELNQKVFDDLKKWEKRWVENSEKINLIWELGEDTKLTDNLQDYVFMTNVITKECVNPYKLLTEAFRILKPGWKIIIVDEHQEVEKLFKKIWKDFKKIWNHIRVLELKKEYNNILEND